MNTVLIICGIAAGIIGLIFLVFYIIFRINCRKSGYRVKLNEMCFEDEYSDGQDFTYKKTRRKG